MKQAFSEKKSDECIRLKIRMLQRRLTYRDVARMAGIHPRVVSNVLCGNDRNWPPREAINRAFAEKIFVNRPRPRARQKPTNRQPPRVFGKCVGPYTKSSNPTSATPAAIPSVPSSSPPPVHSID